jgi:DNA-binding CsgD family transcriptional regulator/tetratricopeptide (TPR) repeat protein
MAAGAPYIAEIVPEVRQRIPGLQNPTALGDPESARFRLFDSITTFLKTVASRHPVVLFLDNLHWSDKPSLLLLEFLAHEMERSRLLVVGTYRDDELIRQHPLSETLGDLARERFLQRIQLRGLSLEEVGEYANIAAGMVVPQELALAIYHRTEGNPLFVSQVVRLLMDEGLLITSRQDQNRALNFSIPEGVKEVIGRRLNRLSESCSQALAVASVIGREFGLNELESLIDHMSEDRLLEALEEAVAGRVIEEVPQAVDRYQFSHVLIRETLYDELTNSRRSRLHHRIGESLEELYQTSPGRQLAHLAYHFSEADAIVSAEKALKYATLSAERDLALLAYEEAARYYAMALQALARRKPVDQARRCQLLLTLADALKWAGESERAREAYQQAANTARILGLHGQLAQAAVGFEEASFRPGLYGGPSVDLLEEALGKLAEDCSPLKARALGSLARTLHFSGRSEEASVVTQRAVELARRLEDPVILAWILNAALNSQRNPKDLSQRLAASTEALKLADQADSTEISLDVYSWYLFDLMEAGDVAELDQALDVYQRLAEQMRQPFYLYVNSSLRATMDIAQGNFEGAELLARRSLDQGKRLKGQDPSGAFAVKMFTIRKEQGRLPEVAPALHRFEQQVSVNGAWRPGLALMYRELDMAPEARTEFEHLAANDFSTIPQDGLQVLCLAYLTEVCTFLDDVPRAAVLYRLLQPWAGHNLVVGGGIAYAGSSGRYLGMLATAMSDWSEAERHFRDALEMDSRMGARTWLAHSQHEYARMLLSRPIKHGESADRQRAGSLLDRALATARELGMRSLTRQVEELQECGTTPLQKAPAYPSGLTPREVEVIQLVATGKTDREVAEELYISVGTASTHVRNILNKTGSANRTEAAAYAARNGLL